MGFLKRKILKNGLSEPVQQSSNIGIEQHRKKEILTSLGPLMPQINRDWWNNLDERDPANERQNNDLEEMDE
jgi:hypothetical protein